MRIALYLALAFRFSLLAEQPSCDCVADFDRLTAKVETDYAGFPQGVGTSSRRTEYEHVKELLRRKAQETADSQCVFVLREMADWFRDGHLLVQEAPKISSAEAARLAADSEVLPLSEADVRRYISENQEHLDPVEGIWYSGEGYRVGIIRSHKPGRRDFAAVMLSGGGPGWKPGQVKAELTRLSAGAYSAVVYVDDHSARHPLQGIPGSGNVGAQIFKGVLLRMAPRVWGKELPLKPGEEGMLAPQDPRAPTLRVLEKGDAVLVSISSQSPEYRERLEKLVMANRDRITSAHLLIIDIRGDEGGSSTTTKVLKPFYAGPTALRHALSLPDDPVVLSSPDNVAYFRHMTPEGWVPQHLIERMLKDPGRLVPFQDPVSGTTAAPDVSGPPAVQPTPLPRPEHVAILMDHGVVSAGEAFVLDAMKSQKVTLFGESTAGVIDYQNVTMIPLACPSRGLLLGYPTLAGSPSLPAGGINGRGIPPDVTISRDVVDPVQVVIDHYRRGPSQARLGALPG